MLYLDGLTKSIKAKNVLRIGKTTKVVRVFINSINLDSRTLEDIFI